MNRQLTIKRQVRNEVNASQWVMTQCAETPQAAQSQERALTRAIRSKLSSDLLTRQLKIRIFKAQAHWKWDR